MFKHTGESFICEKCNFVCKSRSKLFWHAKVHKDEKPYRCTHCEKSFTFMSYLTSHKLQHEQEQQYICTYCDKSFLKYVNQQLHICKHSEKNPPKILSQYKSANNEDDLFICTDYELSFDSVDKLQKQIPNHRVMKPVNCTECPFIYHCKTQQDLQREIKMHLEEKHHSI